MTGLRDYQREAAAALWNDWLAGLQRCAVVLPTGSGKTRIMSALAVERAKAGERVVILVHRDELAKQTVKTLLSVWPEATAAADPTPFVGTVKAERNDIDSLIVVASVQTLARRRRLDELAARLLLFRTADRRGLVLADEIHLSASDSWVAVLKGLGCWSPTGPRTGGFTATMSRADSRGLGDIWEKVSFTRGIKWFIKEGYLVPPVGKVVTTGVDLDRVKMTGGDYNERELGLRMADETVRTAIIDGYREHSPERKGVLFAPTVESALYFAEGLTAAGFPTEGVFGSTPIDNGTPVDRKHIFERYEPGGPTQILASCTALAEGWDAPWCSTAVLARPTTHQGLFIQQVGRALRPWPGKSDAIVLDAAGATRVHSLHALIELNETKPPGEARDDEDEELPDGDTGEDVDNRYRGPVGFEDVDLFAGTDARWMTTAGGVLFVPLADRYVFVAPREGAWSVGECSKRSMRGGRWVYSDLSPDEAVIVGGDYAVDLDPTVASSKAKWRAPSGRPSEKQVQFATSLGIDARGLGKARLSDEIDIRLASRVLAPIGRQA